jgi:competence protein ComEC
MKIALSLIHFWLYHPALLYGIAFLLGSLCHLEGSSWLLIPCASLWTPFLITALHPDHREALRPLSLSFLVFFTAWSTAAIHYRFPLLPEQEISGRAQIKIQAIGLQNSLFGERWLYRCELKQFIPDQASHSIASSLPCIVFLPVREKQSRPLANQDYWVSGKLLQTKQGKYRLKVSSKASWIAIPGSWSWAEQRYQWKQTVSHWIESQFSHPSSASFLAGLATGEFDDYWMRQQFARFGLQHLLAISGFHFAIIAGFLSFILRLFFSQRLRIVTLLFCLGAYCFFLGPQASILRAWIMCSLTLGGELIDKQATALNSLGFALLTILGYHPLLCQELGFQLSFAATAAILLFYQPALTWLSDLFPKRRLSEVVQMSSWQQHGYCVLAFLRQGLALTLAVNAFALPLTLYYFHQFPWMSLLYNLFFPFLATGSLCLLLLGGMLSFLPLLAHAIHRFNDIYTFFLLQFTYQVPSEIDAYLMLNSFHPSWLILYLCVVTLGGILWKQKVFSSQKEEFSFI